ncbi:MAG: HD domain-containing protein [Thermoclostridium sp.]|nr:HD domain-containing protein [Thermoclostridium sp.]
MDNHALLAFLSLAEKLKCNLRHSWTSSGREESVAEHSWRLCLFSWLLRNDFPELDMDKVLLMCLFHDIGEAVTGDIPSFLKTSQHETDETEAIGGIIKMLDPPLSDELASLFSQMQEQKTKEARLFKALDKLEVILQHNEAPLETWIPLEYELNLTYADENVHEFPVLESFRKELKEMTLKHISGNRENKE